MRSSSDLATHLVTNMAEFIGEQYMNTEMLKKRENIALETKTEQPQLLPGQKVLRCYQMAFGENRKF